MKAIGKCFKCGEVVTTTCSDCIRNERGGCANGCDCREGVKWKKVPENEKELMEVEEI